MKKSAVTQELVNIYPPESRVRTSDQSVGYQLLNTMGVALERMQKEIQRGEKNEFVVTANLDEPDLMFKVKLSTDFEFDIDSADPYVSRYLPPTVVGTIGATNYTVNSTPANTLRSVWVETAPNRVSLETTVTGVTDLILDTTASGVLELHHTG
jgi:hypothetical protein